MQTLSIPNFSSPDTEVNPTLNVVIAYEDFETGKRGMKTYNYLVEQLGRDCLFTNQMWKFDVLTVPKLREMAVKDATTAQIVIVAMRGNSDLPPQVRAWAEVALADNVNTIALVALFEDLGEFEESPARDYLADLAKRGNMEFFAQPGNWPGKNQTTGAPWDRNDKTFSILANMMQEREVSVSHWGINE